ncbi:MAG: hypothetical protein K2P81_15445 [Bacteriovoracaceae bacterium]|nr:hypothetical protein [Bacteriovoracaceae bacterium]
MRQWIISAVALITLACLALVSAQSKIHNYASLSPLQVGMSVDQLDFLGHPVSSDEREIVYMMPDQSTLVVAVSDNKVSAAWLELRQPLKIQDPQFKKLRFVQMGMDASQSPTWFYAAAADEGRIFKVSEQGFVESITWVKPFSANGPSRQLQALLIEFTGQRPYRL